MTWLTIGFGCTMRHIERSLRIARVSRGAIAEWAVCVAVFASEEAAQLRGQAVMPGEHRQAVMAMLAGELLRDSR